MIKISLVDKRAENDETKSRIITGEDILSGNLITNTPWSPLLLHKPYLIGANFKSTQLLVFDIDNKPDDTQLSLEEACNNFKNYKVIIATTKSHQKWKDGVSPRDKFRIILEFDTEITNGDQYKQNYIHYAQTLLKPGTADSVGDLGRFFFKCDKVILETSSGELIKNRPFLLKGQKTVNKVSIGTKARLSKKASDWLLGITKITEWHNETRNLMTEMKDKGWDIDEIREKVSAIGTQEWDEKDERRLQNTFNNPKTFFIDRESQKWQTMLLDKKIVMNAENIEDVYLLDETKLTRNKIDKAILNMSGLAKEEIYDKITVAYLEYNPFVRSLFFNKNDSIHFNTYDPPTWQQGYFYRNEELPRALNNPPELVVRFLKHLCDNDTPSYEYILDWLSWAITGRNMTVLTLIGNEGVGKGIFSKLAANMFGRKNFGEGRANLFKGRFNSVLENKRLILLDEVELQSNEEYNLFKSLVNPQIIIEKKGVDERLVENYASFILASNNLAGIRPPADDRRFSLINLASIKLGSVFSSTEIDTLEKDENLAADFARYLLYHTPKGKNTVPFKADEKTNEVEQAGRADWETYLLTEWANDNIGMDVEIRKLTSDMRTTLGMRSTVGRVRLERFALKHPKYFQFVMLKGIRFLRVLGAPNMQFEHLYKEVSEVNRGQH